MGAVYTGSTAEKTFSLRRPEHYTIWIEQHSHHDPGYTDLMSHVFRRHCEWIDAILDEMDKRDGYPEDARLRITAEQFWSFDHYLRTAPPERAEKLVSRGKAALRKELEEGYHDR